jgi:hypothetical protein
MGNSLPGGQNAPSGARPICRGLDAARGRARLQCLIARLLAAQNAIDISRGATPRVYRVDSVGKQTAFSGERRYRITMVSFPGANMTDARGINNLDQISGMYTVPDTSSIVYGFLGTRSTMRTPLISHVFCRFLRFW